ncbi:hypothetical protein NC99_19150 [Sunxiuqinia dokdonensis]|uniref:Uncharacterized protein n=1 Tax=Sunxiuqinia dokdonensis TaxID=1409788 RepID=A0A0L8VAV5_9BACT|nr:hypothetical protein NC99_19150 [Sunxiuqinia dokdonensis]
MDVFTGQSRICPHLLALMIRLADFFQKRLIGAASGPIKPVCPGSCVQNYRRK